MRRPTASKTQVRYEFLSGVPNLTLVCPEVVLAPSIPDSAFSLSYPYKNELVNSLIKVSVYEEASSQCRWLADQPGLGITCRQKMAMADFRKELHIHALLSSEPRVTQIVIHGQKGLLKYIDNTRLVQITRLRWLNRDIFLSLVATLKMVSCSTFKSVLRTFL